MEMGSMPGSLQANWWGRLRRSRVLPVALSIFLIGFTALLFYYAYFGPRVEVADIVPQPSLTSSTGILSLSIEAAGNVEHGTVPLVVNGTIDDSAATGLTLTISVPPGKDTQTQTSCCTVSGSTFSGTAQLGTTTSPIASTPVFTFQLVSNGAIANPVSGNIAVSVQSYLNGGSQFAIAVIGWLSFLATLISLPLWGSRPKTPGGAKNVHKN
jgi:hypothetical protein